jgi:hypothetical protein
MGDITVYRYDVDVSSNGQTETITDVGDVTSAFVRIVGCSKHCSAGPTTSTSNAGPDDASVAVQLTDTDELTFYRQRGTVKVMVEVWVYTGDPGGDYEFISRGRGSITNSGTSNTSSAISSVSDVDKCVPLHNGCIMNEASNSNFEYYPHYMYMDASKQVVVGRNNSGTSGTIYYDVVEFTGSAWSVGHAKSSSHDTNGTAFTGGEVVTMNEASIGSGGSTFDVSDWATAMILDITMGGDSSETGLSDTMIHALPGTGTTTVRMTLDNTNSRNDSDAYCHIIQCDDMAVYRTTNTSISEGNGTYGTVTWPSGAPTTGGIDVLALEWSPGTNGEGTAHVRGAVHAMIRDNSGYEIRHWVHRSGNNVGVAYGVVDLSGLVSAAGVTVTPDLIASEGDMKAPVIKYGVSHPVSLEEAEMTLYESTVAVSYTAEPGLASAEGVLFAPTVTGKALHEAALMTGEGTVLSHDISFLTKVKPEMAQGEFTVNAPTIDTTQLIQPALVQAEMTLNVADWYATVTHQPGKMSGEAVLHKPNVVAQERKPIIPFGYDVKLKITEEV